MIQINPYRRNCEVIKNFFSKPIILFIGIFLFVDVIVSSISYLFVDLVISIDFIKILSSIGFFIFYVKSKSKAPVTSFKAPANILLTANIINIVLNTLLIVGIATIFALLQFNYDFGVMHSFLLGIYYTLVYNIVEIVLSIISSIFFIILISSIKKSTTSIYLYKKGSALFAIIQFALLTFSVFSITHSLLNIDFINIFHITNLINTVISLITTVLLGTFSIMYNRFITKVSNNVFIPKPVAETIDDLPSSVSTPVSPRTPVQAEKPVKPTNSSKKAKNRKSPNETQSILTINDFEQPKPPKRSKSSKQINYDDSLVTMWDIPSIPVQRDNTILDDVLIQLDTQPVFAVPTPDYDYSTSPILAQDNTIPVQQQTNDFEPTTPLFTQDNVTSTPSVNNEQPDFVQENVKQEERPFVFCTSCGTKCPSTNQYCGSCGNRLSK